MTKKWSKLLDRLEKRAGEIVALKIKLAKEKEESTQFYGWWQDEVAVTKQLKLDAANSLDGPDDADAEQMQSTADHDPEAMPVKRMYGKDNQNG